MHRLLWEFRAAYLGFACIFIFCQLIAFFVLNENWCSFPFCHPYMEFLVGVRKLVFFSLVTLPWNSWSGSARLTLDFPTFCEYSRSAIGIVHTRLHISPYFCSLRDYFFISIFAMVGRFNYSRECAPIFFSDLTLAQV